VKRIQARRATYNQKLLQPGTKNNSSYRKSVLIAAVDVAGALVRFSAMVCLQTLVPIGHIELADGDR